MPDVSGVGISFGADRIYDVLEEAELFPEFTSDSTQVFFVNFGEKEAAYCLALVKQLREAGINTELYPDAAKMKKQMTYAHNNGIQFVAMVGTDEIESGKIGLKNMVTGEQSSVTISELISIIRYGFAAVNPYFCAREFIRRKQSRNGKAVQPRRFQDQTDRGHVR